MCACLYLVKRLFSDISYSLGFLQDWVCQAENNKCLKIKYAGSGETASRLDSREPYHVLVTANDGRELSIIGAREACECHLITFVDFSFILLH